MCRLRRPCRRSQICKSKYVHRRHRGSTILRSGTDSGHTHLRRDGRPQRWRRGSAIHHRGRIQNQENLNTIRVQSSILRFPKVPTAASYTYNQTSRNREGTYCSAKDTTKGELRTSIPRHRMEAALRAFCFHLKKLVSFPSHLRKVQNLYRRFPEHLFVQSRKVEYLKPSLEPGVLHILRIQSGKCACAHAR